MMNDMKLFPLLTLALTAVLGLAPILRADPAFTAVGQDKKIIEFGWDSLPSQKLLAVIDQRQDTPFSGMGFLVPLTHDPDSSLCVFDFSVNSEADYPLDTLRALSKKWGRYTDNLIWIFALHKDSSEAFNWFDDAQWQNIERNAGFISLCLERSGAKGVLLDPEHYYGKNPWQYSLDAYPGKNYAAVAMKVRERGRQFMRGLQSVKKEVAVVSLEALLGSGRIFDENYQLALIAPFAMGMLEEATPGSVIMDSAENNYHLNSTAGASYYYMVIRQELLESRVPPELRAKYARQFLASYSLCMDICYKYGSLKAYSNMTAAQQDDYWRNNLYYALRNTDRYVLVYTQFKDQENERLNWYTGAFMPPNAKSIVKEIRERINDNQALGFTLRSPTEKHSTPVIRWLHKPTTKKAGKELKLAYTTSADSDRADLYVDGLLAGSFTGGTVTIPANLLTKGAHQLVLRGWSSTNSNQCNDSDILVLKAE